jgi:lipopolysaccharide biosynthesis protein
MPDFCFFAHFDKDGIVDDYVLHYLKRINQQNFRVVFVSTANLPASEVARVRPHCFDVILRGNAGLDFGSWAAAFAKHNAAIGGRLLLANDSVYGPIGSLAAALHRLTSRPADFYGFVESIEVAPHLQSWFLLFEQRVVRHTAFTAMLARPYSAMSKREIILQGEVDLSRFLRNAGFSYTALYQSSQATLFERSLLGNPTHFLWRELLFEQRIPFLKVELLRDNPLGLEDSDAILSAVSRLDPPFAGVIRRHLSRLRNEDARARQAPMARRLLSQCRSMLLRNAYRRARKAASSGSETSAAR